MPAPSTLRVLRIGYHGRPPMMGWALLGPPSSEQLVYFPQPELIDPAQADPAKTRDLPLRLAHGWTSTDSNLAAELASKPNGCLLVSVCRLIGVFHRTASDGQRVTRVL